MPAAKAVAEAGGSEQCRAPAIRAAAKQLAGRWQARRHACAQANWGSRPRACKAAAPVASSCWPMSTALRRPGLPGRRSPHWPSRSQPLCPVTSPARLRSESRCVRPSPPPWGRSKREIPHYYLASQIDFHAAQAWLLDHNRELWILSSACCRLRCCSRRPRWRCASSPAQRLPHQDGAFRPGLASMSAGPSSCAAAAWSRPRSTTPTDSRCPS